MGISKAFVNAREPTNEEKTMLYIMAIIAPPCPFFVLTGPEYTCRTWEFALSVALQVLAIVSVIVTGTVNVVFLLFHLAAFVYSFSFVHSGFQKGRSLSTGYVDDQEETV
ncbi:uncharacterized protein CXQ87_001100 [Candidozyma duobushaemuli]|uniref:Uncharacterized protein n=1 Tax=Candidozyma duobushaemuli TaxID=1231522 RepID=A0A2V1ALQ9_9ASCO|nr:uncharacterized protein CXQ87_001100 [[Candida] duobushaemulonis]PVH18183.1 hypothetical protein CXQ87_001100 [[Candida] duobushaemulonis]